jgi:two-component system phosphate regulon sensor histidine kinase PhoR
MARRRSTPIIASYVVSLVVTIGLLVVWVVYVTRASARINELVQNSAPGRLVAVAEPPWVLLIVGCVLFLLVIVGLTYQLAETVAARRYSAKQEEFVANITHEMKSPLAAIKLHAQTLQQDDVPVADQGRSLDFILDQVNRLGALVDNILESSRLVRRRQLLDLRPVPLAPLLARYAEAADDQFQGSDVRLTFSGSTDATVLATDDAIERVLTNLLDNAMRFSQPGGEVRCRVRDQKSTVVLEVEDDGIGIPKKELPKIFDRFYQIRRERGGRAWGSGSGLGLYIVSGLVREMRGKVRAYSHEGRSGTRFVVELPRVTGAEVAA